MRINSTAIGLGFYFMLFILATNFSLAQKILEENAKDTELDKKVKSFLRNQQGRWKDLNVPSSDGELLYKIILDKGYKSGLEIGTSTGHSTVWIAWAFSKTDGKLLTIEIDESRYKQALENLKTAGLLDYVDARLANAHNLVKELKGPFDFVFSDADKDWYINYFNDVSPKLKSGGCFTAHNVFSNRRGIAGTREYLEYVQNLSSYTTTVDNSAGGVAISYKH